MPETYSTPAISLRCRPWREHDLLAEVYTLERGKISLMLRGGRRFTSKLAAHLEPLTLLELMVVSGKGMPSAASASSRNCYPLLKSDFEKISAAGWAIGHFNRLIKDELRDDTLFHLLSDFFALLNEAKAEVEWYRWFSKIFLALVLDHLGYGKALETIPNSLYEAAQTTFSRKDFELMNRKLDKWLPATIENAS